MRTFLALLLTVVALTANAQPTRDGNLWLATSPEIKQGFMIGFRSGYMSGVAYGTMTLGTDLATRPGATTEDIQRSIQDASKASQTLRRPWNGVTLRQMLDSVDDFYKEPANRKVEWESAVDYSLKKINGASRADLERDLESLRKMAGRLKSDGF